MFLKQSNNKYKLIEGKGKKDDIQDELNPTVYRLEKHETFFGDELIFDPKPEYGVGKIIDCGIYKEIDNYIENFLSEEQYEARNIMGMKHKLGLLFNGSPGTGKTFLAGQMAQKIINKRNGLGIITNEFKIDFGDLIDELRKIDNNKFIVLVLDEFEKSTNKGPEFLSFMDGPNSRNNIIVLATVNSTEQFDNTLLNRPGRFEVVYNFDSVATTENVLEVMIENCIPKEVVDKYNFNIKSIVREIIQIPGVTIDHVRVKVRNALADYLRKPIFAIPEFCPC
jgi:SpoVK/Ycf46/Vps4 family AAA+-type ATPase